MTSSKVERRSGTSAEDVRTPLSFFLAGTMQGSRRGADQVDQSYREGVREVIRDHFPDAVVRCPAELMKQWLAAEADSLRESHAQLEHRTVVDRTEPDPALDPLASVFHQLVELCASSDVCVAYLPNHEASMGTAVEMWSAFRRGRTVVAISEMRQNLAVFSCSSIIVPSLRHFEELLSSGWIERRERSKKA